MGTNSAGLAGTSVSISFSANVVQLWFQVINKLINHGVLFLTQWHNYVHKMHLHYKEKGGLKTSFVSLSLLKLYKVKLKRFFSPVLQNFGGWHHGTGTAKTVARCADSNVCVFIQFYSCSHVKSIYWNYNLYNILLFSAPCLCRCFMHRNLCQAHCFVMETVALAVAYPDEYVSMWFL